MFFCIKRVILCSMMRKKRAKTRFAKEMQHKLSRFETPRNILSGVLWGITVFLIGRALFTRSFETMYWYGEEIESSCPDGFEVWRGLCTEVCPNGYHKVYADICAKLNTTKEEDRLALLHFKPTGCAKYGRPTEEDGRRYEKTRQLAHYIRENYIHQPDSYPKPICPEGYDYSHTSCYKLCPDGWRRADKFTCVKDAFTWQIMIRRTYENYQNWKSGN